MLSGVLHSSLLGAFLDLVDFRKLPIILVLNSGFISLVMRSRHNLIEVFNDFIETIQMSTYFKPFRLYHAYFPNSLFILPKSYNRIDPFKL